MQRHPGRFQVLFASTTTILKWVGGEGIFGR